MRKIKYIIIFLVTWMASCTDHPFNRYPVENVDFDRIFSDSVRTVGAVNAAYFKISAAYGYYRLDGAMQACATDEAKHAKTVNSIDILVNGRWTKNSTPDARWTDMYEGIRHTNLFLPFWQVQKERLPLTEDVYQRTFGELLFLRAFYHFELFKRYGGIPIMTHILNPGDEMTLPRNTYKETYDFLVEQCDSAAFFLPPTYGSGTDFGRATQGAALALKSRILLYGASELVNNNTDYTDTKDMNVWMGNYDKERWKYAAEAAMDLIQPGKYDLYPGPNYSTYFNASTWANKEFIFGLLQVNDNDMERKNAPKGYLNAEGLTCPTQDFVDAFEMTDGAPFDWKNPVHANQPYENRDPRLSMSVFYNGSKWWYDGQRQSDTGKTFGYIETFKEGLDGKKYPNEERTGYYLRKFSNQNAVISATQIKVNHNVTIFRYAEILLNFAEAANEYGGPAYLVRGKDARWAINEIRKRAGMPKVSDDISQEDLTKRIRNERRIELAFEEHRFWDIRRWKVGHLLKKSVDGIEIIKNLDNSFTYNRLSDMEKRVFERRYYFFPIPQWECERNEKLRQNPEW